MEKRAASHRIERHKEENMLDLSACQVKVSERSRPEPDRFASLDLPIAVTPY